jgi:hypothetical protein
VPLGCLVWRSKHLQTPLSLLGVCEDEQQPSVMTLVGGNDGCEMLVLSAGCSCGSCTATVLARRLVLVCASQRHAGCLVGHRHGSAPSISAMQWFNGGVHCQQNQATWGAQHTGSLGLVVYMALYGASRALLAATVLRQPGDCSGRQATH